MTLPAPLRIFESRRAPNPRRVSVFLAEKGVEIERVEIDIMGGEHFTDAHQGRAGNHHVPVLELANGAHISETVAICRYLEALYPEPNLMGETPLEIAEIEMWHRRVEFSVMFHISQIARHTIPAMQALEHVQVPEWGEACRPRAAKALADLNTRLEASPYIAGDRFTIADIAALVSIDFMRVLRQSPPEELTALHAWLAKVRARPSAEA